MNIVLDTNVLVSAILSPHGPSAAVLRTLLTGRGRLCFDERILFEYRTVLSRDKFAFDQVLVEELIGFLEGAGVPILAEPLGFWLPDPEDQMFIEVAVSGKAEFLVTGNLKHFPKSMRDRVTVVSPREFLEEILK